MFNNGGKTFKPEGDFRGNVKNKTQRMRYIAEDAEMLFLTLFASSYLTFNGACLHSCASSIGENTYQDVKEARYELLEQYFDKREKVDNLQTSSFNKQEEIFVENNYLGEKSLINLLTEKSREEELRDLEKLSGDIVALEDKMDNKDREENIEGRVVAGSISSTFSSLCLALSCAKTARKLKAEEEKDSLLSEVREDEESQVENFEEDISYFIS